MLDVSIITATYNSSQFINETYESILNQTFNSWEWLVTDDCSQDNTWELLNEFKRKDKRIKIWKNEINSGPATARNNSLLNATSDYIAFIDADDLWVPEKLEKQIEFMNNNINFSFTAYELINEKGVPLNKYIDHKKANSFSYEDMLRKKATLGCSTVMLKRKAFADIKMPPILRVGEDYALWLKLLKLNENAYLLNLPLTKYRIVSNSISRNKFKKAKVQWQIYRNIEGKNIMKSIEYFLFYTFRAIFR
jgi:teichuronic acid biosynthesis glycosyltransferase TuaG